MSPSTHLAWDKHIRGQDRASGQISFIGLVQPHDSCVRQGVTPGRSLPAT